MISRSLRMTFLTYAQRGRNQAWRYVATGLLAVILGFAASVVVLTPVMMSGFLARDIGPATFGPEHPREFFVITGVVFACLAAGLVMAARWVQGKRLADLIGAWSWRRFGLAFLAWTAFLGLGALVDFIMAPGGFTVTGGPETLGLA